MIKKLILQSAIKIDVSQIGLRKYSRSYEEVGKVLLKLPHMQGRHTREKAAQYLEQAAKYHGEADARVGGQIMVMLNLEVWREMIMLMQKKLEKLMQKVLKRL